MPINSRLGAGSNDGPSVLMEGVITQHEHHNKQNNNKEENKSWFAILLLQLLQPYAATCVLISHASFHMFASVFQAYAYGNCYPYQLRFGHNFLHQ